MDRPLPKITLDVLNLAAAERRLCFAALEAARNIVGAAQLLGMTRHALKRRMVKLHIDRQARPLRGAPRTCLDRARRRR